MTNADTIKLRVARLENDTRSLYEIFSDFSAEFTGFRAEFDDFRTETRAGFAEVRAEFDEFRTETRANFARVDSTLVEVLRRLPEPA